MSIVTAVGSRRRALRRISKVGLAAAVITAAVAGCAGGAASTAAVPQIDPPTTPATLDRADVDAWLDEVLPAALDRMKVAGATVAVVHDGEILTTRGFGHADTGAGGGVPVPVDPERTLFRAGSVSKLVTATAVMQLVERGELDLDTDVSQYLDFDLPRRYDRDLTLRHLLSHTAGFEERISGLIQPEEARVELREVLANNPPRQLYAPGTVPAYSNYGSSLAGYIVERVSGMPFDDYLDRHVFAPAGMTSSSFRQPLPEELADRLSRAYATAADPAVPFEVVGLPPAGALSAPATDMARFMLAHLGDLPSEQSLLDDQTRHTMHTAALGEDSLGALAGAPRMTLGFFDESRNGRRIIGHGGDTNYFHSHLQLYLEERTGIFLSLNSTGESALDNVLLRQAIMNGFADRYFPSTELAGQPAAAPVDAGVAREHAVAAAGTYTSARGFHSNFLSVGRLLDQVKVTALDDGRLRFDPDPGTFTPAVYEAISPTVWREVGGQRTMAMRVVDGEVTAIAHDSAFALVPIDPIDALALPVLVGSLLVLLVTVLVLPAGAVVRRLRRRPAPQRRGRLARILTRVAVVSALVGALGWVMIIMSVMNLQDVPTGALRVAQALLLIGVAGQVPAVVRLVDDIRHRHGGQRIVGSALVLLALSGLASFAFEFHLLAPSVSY